MYGWDVSQTPNQRVPLVASPDGHLHADNLNGLRPVEAGGGTTISNTVVDAPALDDATSHVWWEIQDNPVKVRFDGTNPAAGTGLTLSAGDHGMWPRAVWEAAKFIRSDAADAELFRQEFAS